MKALLPICWAILFCVVQVSAVFTGHPYLRNLTYAIAILSAFTALLSFVSFCVVSAKPETAKPDDSPSLPKKIGQVSGAISLTALIMGGWWWCAIAKGSCWFWMFAYRYASDEALKKQKVAA